jgi:tetratricopeptide (TPR) repeat protein
MSDTQEGWNNIEVSEEKVDFEIEEEEASQKVAKPVEAKEKTVEEPEELDGIETKGAQKRIRQLVSQRKSRDEQIQKLMQDNEELQRSILTREKQFTDTQKVSTEVSEQQLTDKIELARSNYKEAYEDGDSDKVLKAQEALNKAQLDLQNLGERKAALSNYEKALEQRQEQKRVAPQAPDPKAQSWAAENEWFGKDSVRTAAALAIDAELKQMGFDTSDDDFYTEVDRRLKKEFPHRYEEVEEEEEVSERVTKQPAQVVAGASRKPASSSKKVKLSQEDVRLATKWNIPLEVYATEKRKADLADGEYTTIETQRGG